MHKLRKLESPTSQVIQVCICTLNTLYNLQIFVFFLVQTLCAVHSYTHTSVSTHSKIDGNFFLLEFFLVLFWTREIEKKNKNNTRVVIYCDCRGKIIAWRQQTNERTKIFSMVCGVGGEIVRQSIEKKGFESILFSPKKLSTRHIHTFLFSLSRFVERNRCWCC